MPGIADLLYLGQPDPARQLAAMLSGQQPQGAPPQGPAPPAATPAPAGGAAAAPGDGANPSPGDPPPPGSPPQPQALTPPPAMAQSYQALANPPNPNIMSLYLQMQQRQQAEAGFNSGLALIAANHSPPSMRNAIMQSLTGNQGDASGMVNNLLSLHQAMTQQSATQDMLSHASDYDTKLNLPPGTSRDMILAGRGSELVGQLMPTTETRDIQAKHDMFIKNAVAQGQDPTAAEATWQRDYMPFLLTGGAGGGDSATRSWQTERIRWNQDNPGQPVPWGSDDPQSFALWKAQQGEMVKDQEDARDKLHKGYEQNLTDLRGHLGNIIGLKPGGDPNNPDDYDQGKLDLLKSALSKPGAQAYLSGDPKDLTTQGWGAALAPEEKAVLDEARETGDPKSLYGTLGQRAPRRGQSDVSEVNSGLNGLLNVRKGFDRYLDGVKTTIGATDKALGNGYGAAGEAENAPDYTKPLINDAYLPGGSMYPFGKKALPMSQDDIAQATAKMKAAQDPEKERQLLIKIARANNYDATPLKNLRF